MLRALLRLPIRTAHAFTLRLLGTVTGVRTTEPVVALTFDDGPHPDSTPPLLDILRRHHARATFFMVGKAARAYPDLVCAVTAAGHAIGNHSWDHPSFRVIAGRERRRQLRACEAALGPVGTRLFRPPYGHQSLASRLDALLTGYHVITWTLQAIDWLDYEPDRLLTPLLPRIVPGSIILFHDAVFPDPEQPWYRNRRPTLAAVDCLLDRLGQTYRFVTVPELFQYGPPQRQHWYWKPHPDMLSRLAAHPSVGR